MMNVRNCGTSLAFSILSLLALAAPRVVHAQEQGTDNCVSCHSALSDERLAAPARSYAEDIHAARGFTCSDCHGGDPSAAGFAGMDPAKGFVGKPSVRRTPEFCGRCHSDAAFMRQYNPSLRVDQVQEYATSVHGRRLRGGDTAVAVCTSCHPSHNIRPPADPQSSVNPLHVAETCGTCHANAEHMAGYGIPTTQLADYQQSIHWQMMSEQGDLSAPTCNDCHGNHGAAPPGVSSVANVCGQCHAVMAENFATSRHSETFAMLGVPGCATCHGNHAVKQASDVMLGLGEGAVCARCHSAGDPGGQAAERMRRLLDSLNVSFAAADSILERAEVAGMEVSGALFDLGAANNAGVKARAAMHSFDLNAVESEVDSGLTITHTAFLRGLDAMAELKFRRTGLAVSVGIILVLIAGLLLRIRMLDQRKQTT